MRYRRQRFQQVRAIHSKPAIYEPESDLRNDDGNANLGVVALRKQISEREIAVVPVMDVPAALTVGAYHEWGHRASFTHVSQMGVDGGGIDPASRRPQ
jgi:hypothetical protein